jgi:hypothetical protein
VPERRGPARRGPGDATIETVAIGDLASLVARLAAPERRRPTAATGGTR